MFLDLASDRQLSRAPPGRVRVWAPVPCTSAAADVGHVIGTDGATCRRRANLHGSRGRLGVSCVASAADVLVVATLEDLPVLGEVPLDCAVHELAATRAKVESDDSRRLLGALGDVFVGTDIVADTSPHRIRDAPRFPRDVIDKAGGVSAVEDLGWFDLPETLAETGEDTCWPTECRGRGHRRRRRRCGTGSSRWTRLRG